MNSNKEELTAWEESVLVRYREKCIAQAEAVEECARDFHMKGAMKACMLMRAANLRQKADQPGTLGRVVDALLALL